MCLCPIRVGFRVVGFGDVSFFFVCLVLFGVSLVLVWLVEVVGV